MRSLHKKSLLIRHVALLVQFSGPYTINLIDAPAKNHLAIVVVERRVQTIKRRLFCIKHQIIVNKSITISPNAVRETIYRVKFCNSKSFKKIAIKSSLRVKSKYNTKKRIIGSELRHLKKENYSKICCFYAEKVSRNENVRMISGIPLIFEATERSEA